MNSGTAASPTVVLHPKRKLHSNSADKKHEQTFPIYTSFGWTNHILLLPCSA